MPNKAISALDTLTTPASGDLIPITDIDDTSGSSAGTTKKVSVSNLIPSVPVQSVASKTGVVTLANTDISGLGTASTLDVGTADTNVVQLADVGGTVKLPAVDGSALTNIQVDLESSLRGTTNPHIGAFPNQSFQVIDNPEQSVMVIADSAGNLKLLNSLGVNNIAVGFSVVEDSTEPDIEVVSGTETFSVLSGDSDSVGVNGLPYRQGFHNPDIGANPAQTLISGGSIA
jgi:hypothetical protein